ncbi:MAG: cation:proton antiporter [Gemmataceae bacterium]|nr:cation:proton antiporter [Gemmataceae bacterium]
MSQTILLASVEADVLVQGLRRVHVEEVLLPILVQLVVIILAARGFAVLLRRVGQPSVVGEVVAGLLLGPSVLGRFFPDVANAIFHPDVAGVSPELFDVLIGWVFTTLSQLGLILLLFLVGLEFDFSHLRWHGKAALSISLTGVLLPFVLGLGLAWLLRPLVADSVPLLGFALFLGTALAITAIPVLARMMMELNITRTRLGTITISAAAFDDATGWILLASVAALARAEFDLNLTLLMIGESIIFAVLMVFVARPLLRHWVRRVLRPGDGEISPNGLAIVLAVVFVCSIVTNRIGIFAIFGAFFLGAVLSAEHDFRKAMSRRLRDFVTVFFVPIFFTYTGLRTNIGTLDSWGLWLLCGLVSFTAIVGKMGGCGLAGWLGGLSPRDAACVSVLMNTRGLMALVVINVGRDLGVIPDSVYCMLVIMALVTTVMTTPVLMRLMRGTELEPYILRSAFDGASAIGQPTENDPIPREQVPPAS